MLRTPTGRLRGVPGDWLELLHLLPGGSEGTPWSGSYRPIVDLNGHESMGGKTFLYLIDGIYGGEN